MFAFCCQEGANVDAVALLDLSTFGKVIEQLGWFYFTTLRTLAARIGAF